jgi:small glutamine-rich tetratricopeptide repeat-containing protein alpha
MDTSSVIDTADSPKQQVVFAFLEYLQDLLKDNKIEEDNVEGVEVALQCLSATFGVDINNEEMKKKYSIKPHSLPTVLGLGLAGKDKLAKALEQMVRN